MGINFTNLQVTDNPTPDAEDAPDAAEFEFTNGFLDFEIEGLEEPGQRVTISLLLPTGVDANTYWIYDEANQQWQEFLFDGETGAEFFDLNNDGTADRLLLHFADGQRGD